MGQQITKCLVPLGPAGLTQNQNCPHTVKTELCWTFLGTRGYQKTDAVPDTTAFPQRTPHPLLHNSEDLPLSLFFLLRGINKMQIPSAL